MPFLVPTETHNFVHFYWVASYFIQTGCSACQVPSLNCSHVSPSACRLLGLDVTRASGQLAPSLTPSGASRRIEGKTEPQQTPIQCGLAVHLPQCPLFLSFPSIFMPKEKCPLLFSRPLVSPGGNVDTLFPAEPVHLSVHLVSGHSSGCTGFG